MICHMSMNNYKIKLFNYHSKRIVSNEITLLSCNQISLLFSISKVFALNIVLCFSFVHRQHHFILYACAYKLIILGNIFNKLHFMAIRKFDQYGRINCIPIITLSYYGFTRHHIWVSVEFNRVRN